MSYQLIVEITDPKQELALYDAGVKVVHRDKDVIWDSVMTKDRLCTLVETTLNFYIENEFFPKSVIPKANFFLENYLLFNSYLNDVFEAYKSNYQDQLGMSYDDSDEFIAHHFEGYVNKHPEFFSLESKETKSVTSR